MTTDERLKKVEGQLARVKWCNRCLAGCIVLSVAVWFIVKTFGPETAWAQSPAKEIRATKFVLEDNKGKTRATLAVTEDGPGLLLGGEYDESGAGLTVRKDEPELFLHDENSKMSARLLVIAEGPALVLRENGKTRAELGVLNDTPQLVLLDENGKPCAAMSVDQDGPKLGLFEKNGKPIWEVP